MKQAHLKILASSAIAVLLGLAACGGGGSKPQEPETPPGDTEPGGTEPGDTGPGGTEPGGTSSPPNGPGINSGATSPGDAGATPGGGAGTSPGGGPQKGTGGP